MSDYETTQRRRNITVGIFVLIALCALVWLVFRFGDLPSVVSEIRSYSVFVKFPTAQGVQKDTPVRFCGYRIGRVTKIKAPEPLKDDKTGLVYHQTVCVLSIDKKYVNIPSNVDIKVMTRGLGSSYIEIKIDPTKKKEPLDASRPEETMFLADGVMLQGSTGMTSEFFPEESQKKLDELADGLLALINNTNDIIGDRENKDNLKTSLANLSKASERVAQTIEEFEKFAVAGITVSEELSKTTLELRLILEKINNGEGTAAKLVNDARLYENLLENTEQLEVLIRSVKDLIAEYRAKGIKVKL